MEYDSHNYVVTTLLSITFVCSFLNETYYARFQVHNFIFGYYYNSFRCITAQKTHLFAFTVLWCSGVNPLCLKCCFS